jgi:hypothetical protein
VDLEAASRFSGGQEVSALFRFFWEEGIVKKEDMVVVFCKNKSLFNMLWDDETQKLFFCRRHEPLSF